MTAPKTAPLRRAPMTNERFSGFARSRPGHPIPIVLHRRAQASVAAHARRGIVRIITLVLTDAFMVILAHALFDALGAWSAGRPAGALTALAAAASRHGPMGGEAEIATALLGLLVLGNYGQGDNRRDPSALLIGVSAAVLLERWVSLWTEFSPTGIVTVASRILVLWLLVLVGRLLVNGVVRRCCARYGWGARVLLVGTRDSARRALTSPFLRDAPEINAVGYLDLDAKPAADALGSSRDFVRIVEEQRIDTVVVTDMQDEERSLRLIDIAEAAGCHVFTLPAHFNEPGIEPALVWRRGAALVQINRPGATGQQYAVKRLFDVAASVLLLVLLAPVLAGVAAAVRVSSPGPIFFGQVRVGRGGRHFRMFKFRSMVRDAEARKPALVAHSVYPDARLFKIVNDPRVTPLGRFLRRTSLDELPQLWNVLRGDMSLVGPRPPVPSEVEQYAEYHYTRFDVKPGITGPWQVSGRNNITCFDEVIQLEAAYIRRWNLWRDFAILFRTIPVVLKMDGAH